MKEDIEEPLKKSPLLIAGLLLLEILLIITGILLVSWYVDNLEQGIEQASLNRVLVSGVAVALLLVLLTVILINLLGKQRKSSSKGRRTHSKTSTSASQRASLTKKPVRRTASGARASAKRTTKHS